MQLRKPPTLQSDVEGGPHPTEDAQLPSYAPETLFSYLQSTHRLTLDPEEDPFGLRSGFSPNDSCEDCTCGDLKLPMDLADYYFAQVEVAIPTKPLLPFGRGR